MTEIEPRLAPSEERQSAKARPNGGVRIAALAILGAAIFWLGYGVGRVQNIADVSRLTRDADVARYTLTKAGTLVHFERLGGDGKPFIRSADGYELLDLSDWDHNSRIVVDGSTFELVRLYPTSSVDYGRSRLAETLQGDGWLLEREVSLDGAGLVHVSHTFVARRPIHRVDLALAYVHRTLLNLTLGGDGASAGVSRQTPDQAANGVSPPVAYKLEVKPDADSPPIAYRAGDASPLGATSFVADMSADDPKQDVRTPLGTETIRIQPVS